MTLEELQKQIHNLRNRQTVSSEPALFLLSASVGQLMAAEAQWRATPDAAPGVFKQKAEKALVNTLKHLTMVASDWGISLDDLAKSTAV